MRQRFLSLSRLQERLKASIFIAGGLVLLSLALCRAATAEETPDLGALFLSPATWAMDEPLGAWRVKSETKEEKILQHVFPSKTVPAFTVPAMGITAHYAQGQLQEIRITYLELGLVFGAGNDRQSLPATEFNRRKRAFSKLYDAEEKQLVVAFTQLFGHKRRVKVGKNQHVASYVDEWTHKALKVRLYEENRQLLMASIVKAEAKTERRTRKELQVEARQNVETRANGDIVVTNVPAVEQGKRGYCLMGTLAMVLRYFGGNADIERLAAKAKYREGAYTMSAAENLIRAAASEVGLRCNTNKGIRLADVKAAIDQGVPIMMGRRFTRERDAFHTAFAKLLRAKPELELPDPKADKERWPTRRDSGHASLIVGYNDRRGEILFSESWGREYVERRMRTEEAKATVDRCWVLMP